MGKDTVSIGNTECFQGIADYQKEFTKQAMNGPNYTYDAAIQAMKPNNHGKKLSEYYPDLEEYGL